MRVVAFLGVALAIFVGGMGMLVPRLLAHPAPAPEAYVGTTSVFLVPYSGGRPLELLRLAGQWEFPVATRDGKALLLERPSVSDGTTTWRVPLDGSPRTKVGWQQVFTAPPGWKQPNVPSRVEHMLASMRLADYSQVPGDRAVYAVRLNQAVSIPK